MEIAFLGSAKPAAQGAVRALIERYGQSDLSVADYVVAIGGDGTVLKALHAVMTAARPVFAMRVAGSAGVLANDLELANLPQRLLAARRVTLHPLEAQVRHAGGTSIALAVNEIVLMRQRLQAARLRVGGLREAGVGEVIGDGLLVATPIGSTGYNRSAGGSTLPQGSALLAVTALVLNPRSRWCNRIVGDDAVIDIEVIDPEHRPVRLETSLQQVSDVRHAHISCRRDISMALLFDARGEELPGSVSMPPSPLAI